jgi:xanthine dehydrogenase molybdopterin-binding subunit B
MWVFVCALQVRLVVPQSVDVSLNAGRCPMVMDWTAGLDQMGRVQALQLQLTLMVSEHSVCLALSVCHMINQSFNQSINQSINQSLLHL